METPSLNDLVFRIKRSSLPKAEALASSLGIELVVSEIDPVPLAFDLYETQTGHIPPRYASVAASYDALPDPFKVWARHLCEKHVHIFAQAPLSEWSVIALADRSDGAPMFHNIDPASEYWTPEAMDSIDFSRCDECGVKNRRNKAFIVRKGDVVRQIGGSCAKHLDLTKKIRDLLEGFQSFMSALNDKGEDWGGGFGGGEALNLPLAIMLAEELIAFEGYVSGKAAEACFRMSTRDQVSRMLFVPKGASTECRDNDQWREASRRWIAGEAPAVMTEIQTWLEGSADDQFHRNIRTAIANESRKHLGLIVFAVAEIRNWRLAIKARDAGVTPKCYEYMDSSPEAIAEACGLTVAALGELLGHDLSGKVKAPARKALAKVLPGVWTLIARASWEGSFGWQDMVQFQREDGARVKWITGSLDPDVKWVKGEEYRILSASLGDDLGDHAKYGVQGRKISRATIRPVKPENMNGALLREKELDQRIGERLGYDSHSGETP